MAPLHGPQAALRLAAYEACVSRRSYIESLLLLPLLLERRRQVATAGGHESWEMSQGERGRLYNYSHSPHGHSKVI